MTRLPNGAATRRLYHPILILARTDPSGGLGDVSAAAGGHAV